MRSLTALNNNCKAKIDAKLLCVKHLTLHKQFLTPSQVIQTVREVIVREPCNDWRSR